MPRVGPNDLCPCGMGRKYKRCCAVFHRGRPARSPEELMRSRFSAYAAGLAEYIIKTTDPTGPMWQLDKAEWTSEIVSFAALTRFEGVLIFEHGSEGDEGFVRFRAELRQGDRDASFEETSRFNRVDGRWLYFGGTVAPVVTA